MSFNVINDANRFAEILSNTRITCYYQRRQGVEQDFLKKLKLSQPLIVMGEVGVGKTALISHLLNEDLKSREFLVKEFNLTAAIWLSEFDREDFSEKLVEQCRKFSLKSDQDLPTTLAYCQEKRVLFVFDNVLNLEMAEFVLEKCHQITCCLILSTEIGQQFVDQGFRGHVVRVPSWNRDEIKTLLSGEMLEKCSDQLNSPLVCRLIASCYDSKLATTKNIAQIFAILIENVVDDEKLRKMYFAFLLFKSDEPVRVIDVANLWGFKRNKEQIDQAFETCQLFEKMSLLRRLLDDDEYLRPKSSKRFLVHEALHEAAVKYAFDKFKFASLNELRFKIATGFCCQKRRLIVFKTVDFQNRHLLERIVSQLDEASLLKICNTRRQQKGGNVVTFLPFLLDAKWHDDIFRVWAGQRVLHSYRVTTKILVKLTRKEANIGEATIEALLRQKGSLLFGNCFINRFLHVDPDFRQNNPDYLRLKAILEPWLLKDPKAIEVNEAEIGQKLIAAVKRGNFEIVREIVGKSPKSVESIDQQNKRTLLSYAVTSGSFETVRFLCEKCPRLIELACRFGRTPLAYAAWSGNYDIAKFLHEKWRRALETRCIYGRTPLSYAASSGNFQLFQFLFENAHLPLGKMPRCSFYRRSLLSYAASSGNVEICRFLCQNYPDSVENGSCKQQRTPLCYAASSGRLETVRLLYERYPFAVEELDKSRRTALHFAVDSANLDLVKFLYEKFPDALRIKDIFGRTPLSYAASRSDCPEIAKFFHENWPEAAELPDRDYYTPFSYAMANCNFELARFLLENHPVVVDVADRYKRTALFYAATRGVETSVRILFVKQPEFAEKSDATGQTPLQLAKLANRLDILELLSQLLLKKC